MKRALEIHGMASRFIQLLGWIWMMDRSRLTMRKLLWGTILVPLGFMFVALRYPRLPIQASSRIGKFLWIGDPFSFSRSEEGHHQVPVAYILMMSMMAPLTWAFIHIVFVAPMVLIMSVDDKISAYMRRTRRLVGTDC